MENTLNISCQKALVSFATSPNDQKNLTWGGKGYDNNRGRKDTGTHGTYGLLNVRRIDLSGLGLDFLSELRSNKTQIQFLEYLHDCLKKFH